MRWLLICLMVGTAWAQTSVTSQGTTPKASASAYPVSGTAGEVEVGAEYMVHSFSRGEEMFIAPDHLVVEVALFPPKGTILTVEPAKIRLRMNGRTELLPVSPESVASALEYPASRSGRGLQVGGGMGPVIFGQPQGGGGQMPAPPRVPQSNPSGLDPRQRDNPVELVVQTALPAGDAPRPVSGYVYFAYSGKTKSIRSLELLYGGIVLKLR